MLYSFNRKLLPFRTSHFVVRLHRSKHYASHDKLHFQWVKCVANQLLKYGSNLRIIEAASKSSIGTQTWAKDLKSGTYCETLLRAACIAPTVLHSKIEGSANFNTAKANRNRTWKYISFRHKNNTWGITENDVKIPTECKGMEERRATARTHHNKCSFPNFTQ